MAEMTNKVRGYLLNRKRDLEQEIYAMEQELVRLKDMLEEQTPSILQNAIKQYPTIESGYRVLFKNKNIEEEYRFWTHDSERDRCREKVSVWPTLYSAQNWVNYYSNIYSCKIIDENGNEVKEKQ